MKIEEDEYYFRKYIILYDEKEEMGMADCSVMIKINENEVTISRKGDFSAKMIYQKGVSKEFLYHMPYGTLPMVLTTEEIEFSFDENGGELNMVYFLSVSSDYKNKLKVTVKKD